MVRHRLDSVNDFARQGYLLKVACVACGHIDVRHPVSIMRLLHERGLSQDISNVERRMRCGHCRARGASISPTFPED